MDDLTEKAPTDPLINFLRCYIAVDVPDEVAVQALRQARAEHRHASQIVLRAAHIIRSKG